MVHKLPAGNAAIRFTLEVCALAALGYGGWSAPAGVLPRLLLAIGAPVVAATLWGTLVAPKAANRLADPWRLGPEIAVFSSASLALLLAGRPALAISFGVIASVSLALTFVLDQRDT